MKTQQQIIDAKHAIKQAENQNRSDAINRLLSENETSRLKFDCRLLSVYAVLVTLLALIKPLAAILGK